MYVDFASDWPAYLFMVIFVVFFAYIIVVTKKSDSFDKGNKK
jgi:hypothetical protein